MPVDFNEIIDRRRSASAKWRQYGPDVLPMWVADMDFRAPQPVIDALARQVQHGVFGYEWPTPELTEVICARLRRLYGWQVEPCDIVYMPGVVTALNVACRAFGGPGTGMLVQTPVYPLFLSAPPNHGMALQAAPLACTSSGGILRYEMDWDAFEQAITPETRLFILCHPHNPTGVEYDEATVRRMAAICLERGIIMVSDEIHCELMLGGAKHTPAALVAPDIAGRCITLMAPSKTFNVPGLGCSFAVIQDPDLRERFCRASNGIVPHLNSMGLTAAMAAYRDSDVWLANLLAYLTANRDYLVEQVRARLPGISVTVPDATYLAWLDCRGAGIPGSPYRFFLEHARVALNEGAAFGENGAGFVRLNFGTQRARLGEGLDRMAAALAQLKSPR